MANIDFGETTDQQLATLMVIVNALHLTIRGNGSEGLEKRAERFMSEHEGALKEQMRQHQENSAKLDKSNAKQNWIIVIATVIMAIIAIMGFVVTVELKSRADLDPAKIFHSYAPEPSLSSDAGLPPTYQAR